MAELFAEAISRVHAGESVSSLFDGVDPSLGPPQPKLPVRRLIGPYGGRVGDAASHLAGWARRTGGGC